mmetsp:Transcript_26133/g.72003  ORF Transcript_26133/g.72003 Transcript_26133/m.72003 type:complete len:123 (+) Transcript_26133:1634-2002(+)|eukprot:scaffold191750_cov31-Tisochrysis_lutea.AAC.2
MLHGSSDAIDVTKALCGPKIVTSSSRNGLVLQLGKLKKSDVSPKPLEIRSHRVDAPLDICTGLAAAQHVTKVQGASNFSFGVDIEALARGVAVQHHGKLHRVKRACGIGRSAIIDPDVLVTA